MTLCDFAEELSIRQLDEKITYEENAQIKSELSRHLATCIHSGCKECLENRVSIGLQDRDGNYKKVRVADNSSKDIKQDKCNICHITEDLHYYPPTGEETIGINLCVKHGYIARIFGRT